MYVPTDRLVPDGTNNTHNMLFLYKKVMREFKATLSNNLPLFEVSFYQTISSDIIFIFISMVCGHTNES